MKMSKPWKLAVVVVVFVFVATSFIGCLGGGQQSAIDRIKSKGQLVVGTSSGFPPFEMIDNATGNVIGLDMDIAKAIANDLNVSLKIQDFSDFGALIGAVKGGQVDMVLAGMSITDERNQSVSFSNPYYKADQAIIVRNDSSIASPADLTGKTIAVNTGTTGASWVDDNLVKTGNVSASDVKSYGTASTTVVALTTGAVDAVVIDAPVARTYVNQTSGIKVVYNIVTDENYGIAMNKNDKDLVDRVNIVLKNLQDSGQMDQLIKTWFG